MRDEMFEWDDAKAASNLKKHGVSFEEAAAVFGDPLAELIEDIAHSPEEFRLKIIGRTHRGVILCVVHTDRRGRIRIISASRAAASEVRFYARSY